MTMSKTSACVLLLIAAVAGTAGCAGRNAPDAEHPSYTVSRSVGEQLKAIGAQLEAQDWDGALTALQDLEANNELNPYEQALVWQMRGGAHLGQENATEG